MKPLNVIFLAAVSLPVLAFAEVVVEDSDGDGVYSAAELAVAYPEMTDEIFSEIDGDADGRVTAEELAAAIAAGIVAG